MPIRHKFYSNGVLIWNWGIITGDEIIPANRKIYEHNFEDDFEFQLCDLSGVTDMQLTPDDIKTIASDDIHGTANLNQVSVIVARTDYIYGMCRMWDMLAGNESFRAYVIRAKEEALEILSKSHIHLNRNIIDEFMRELTDRSS